MVKYWAKSIVVYLLPYPILYFYLLMILNCFHKYIFTMINCNFNRSKLDFQEHCTSVVSIRPINVSPDEHTCKYIDTHIAYRQVYIHSTNTSNYSHTTRNSHTYVHIYTNTHRYTHLYPRMLA